MSRTCNSPATTSLHRIPRPPQWIWPWSPSSSMDPAMVASASAIWGPGGLHPPTQRYGEGRGERVRAGATLVDEENRERERGSVR